MDAVVTDLSSHRTIEAIWRMESAKIIAILARILRDVGRAEELAQDALVTALERWPKDGVPGRPAAWLLTTARNRALDELRRGKLVVRTEASLRSELETSAATAPPPEDLLDDEIGDDLLRLIFIACHPVLATEARLALTLRLLGGLTTDEIARAFLQSEPTIAQRIVRAKRRLAEAHVPFDIPRSSELAARLASVLEVIYLVFNEGYAATAGDDWTRPALCEEALRLGRVLAELVPAAPEAHGLVALLELQASRLPARVSPSGEPILLLEQARARWDQLLIRRGLVALERAEALGGALGPYALQAAVAACHARARAPVRPGRGGSTAHPSGCGPGRARALAGPARRCAPVPARPGSPSARPARAPRPGPAPARRRCGPGAALPRTAPGASSRRRRWPNSLR